MKQLTGDQSMANWNTLFSEVRGLTEILEDKWLMMKNVLNATVSLNEN